MTRKSDPPDAQNEIHQVRIGNVEGGIHDTIIAGRDVHETAIEQLVYNVCEDDTAAKEQRDRRDVLDLMKRLWITHGLERSLAGVALIAPIIEARPDAVAHPWEMVVDTSDQMRELLPAGVRVVDILVDIEGSLLILGEPGSGKTASLLELARQAIACAEQDPIHPIPVVLDLAWWTNRKQRFADWLVGILSDKYYIKEDTVRTWLENDELLLLLDRLDQVQPQKRREVCVEAINEFCQEHGLISLVVCCRTASYEALEKRLQLRGAICLQPAYV